MKKILLPLIFISSFAMAQDSTRNFNFKYIRFPSIFLSGACEGIREAMKFYPDKLPESYNPENTWKNKYKNADLKQGEAFPGSTTVFVGFTDKYHATGLIRTLTGLTYTAGVCYKFNDKNSSGKKLCKEILKELLFSSIFYNAGKTITMQAIKNTK